VFPIFEPEGCADSYSIQQIKHIAAAVAEGGTIPVEEVDLWATDLRSLSSTSSYFFSVNRYVFVARAGPYVRPS
jgi:hypothetical protein